MSPVPEMVPSWLWKALTWVLTGVLAILGWAGKRYIEWRGAQIEDLRGDLEDMREEMQEEHREVDDKLDQILDEVQV